MKQLTQDSDFNESQILSACAQRFDGWKFIEDTGFEPDEVLNYFFETGVWDAQRDELLAVFFILARAFRWNLEYEPLEGRYWRAYRVLFFALCTKPVPKKYRHPTLYDEWDTKFAPRVAHFRRRVDEINRQLQYDDSKSLAHRLLDQKH